MLTKTNNLERSYNLEILVKNCLHTIVELGEDLLICSAVQRNTNDDITINIVISLAEKTAQKSVPCYKSLFIELVALDEVMKNYDGFETMRNDLKEIITLVKKRASYMR